MLIHFAHGTTRSISAKNSRFLVRTCDNSSLKVDRLSCLFIFDYTTLGDNIALCGFTFTLYHKITKIYRLFMASLLFIYEAAVKFYGAEPENILNMVRWAYKPRVMLLVRIPLTACRLSPRALCGFPSAEDVFCVFSETRVSFPLGTEEGAPQIGGLSVTDLQKDQITTMRGQGYGYATIAKSVGLKKDAVVAFCRKAGLTGTKATDNSRISLSADFCPQCGAPLRQTPGRKRVRFCSSSCRAAWWNAHPEAVRRRYCQELDLLTK